MLGLGGLNPKKMEAIMKQMGISQQEIQADYHCSCRWYNSSYGNRKRD